MSIVLTSPHPGGVPGTLISNVFVPSHPPYSVGSNVVIVDNCVCSQNTSIKWIYTVKSETGDKVAAGEVLALHRLGANPTHSRYGMIGDLKTLPHKVNIIMIGSALGFEFTNLSGGLPNPADRISYRVSLVRIQVLT